MVAASVFWFTDTCNRTPLAAHAPVGAQFCISQEEYALAFDGLPLRKKLSFLTSIKGLPVDSHADIVKKAQELTPRHSGSTLPHSRGGRAPMPPLLSSKNSALTERCFTL